MRTLLSRLPLANHLSDKATEFTPNLVASASSLTRAEILQVVDANFLVITSTCQPLVRECEGVNTDQQLLQVP